jgi:REP element-mobilizing transposase RayT
MACLIEDRNNASDGSGVPLAYFLTFRTYGTWLPGAESGTMDRKGSHIHGAPLLPPNRALVHYSTRMLRCAPVLLDNNKRCLVDQAIRSVCTYRGWLLLALNVRTNHVHLVVSAASSPELALNSLKAWATRRLVERGCWQRGVKLWARHGSTRYLWEHPNIEAACTYTREAQDVPHESPLPNGRGTVCQESPLFHL